MGRLVEKINEFYKDWSDEKQEFETNMSMAYDAFRGDYSSGNLARWRSLEGTTWRSKVFVRLTKMKVVSAVSQIEDVYFQGNEMPFTVEPTPVAENMSGMVVPPEEAKLRAGRMKMKIKDAFVEDNVARKEMMAILEMAIYGMSILEAPVIRKKIRTSYKLQVPKMAMLADMAMGTQLSQQYARHIMVPETIYYPSVEHPNLWDMFWDMEAEDFQTGQGVIKRVMLSKGMLRTYMDIPGFDKEAIARVIAKNGGNSSNDSESHQPPNREKLSKKNRTIRALNFCGRMPVEDLSDTPLWDEKEKDGKEREIVAVIADDEVIYQPKKNPWTNNLRPYHPAYWELVPHESTGVGIPENLKDSQMMVNSGYRCFIDNKALSGNVLIAGNPRQLAPGSNRDVYPGKFFELAQHVMDSRQALQFFSPPDVGNGLLELIGLAERFADEESNMPKLLEGQKSVGDPKTAYAFSKLVENANKALGKVIRNIDGGHTEPIVKSFYHWYMETDPDESIKGDYTCKAMGFGTYKDRVVRGDNLQMFLAFMLSNQMLAEWPRIDQLLSEIARARDIDPLIFLKQPEEVMKERMMKLQLMASQMAPPQIAGGKEEPQEAEVVG